MKAELSTESMNLVYKMAYKFAYSTTSLEYEEYCSVGLEGLIKAIKSFKEDNDTQFATYANTCIRNAMCTKQKILNKFDLQEDENVIIEDIDTLSEEMADGKMVDEVKYLIRKVNKGNERNAEMVMLHIGLEDEAMDYKEISLKFNVSAERVRQIYNNTISLIKEDKKGKELLYSFVG